MLRTGWVCIENIAGKKTHSAKLNSRTTIILEKLVFSQIINDFSFIHGTKN
jgi:hypothetical protein